MPQHVVLLSIPGLRERDLSSMPNLGRLATGGGYATLVPSFPAVTCPVQANMTTGVRPREHGVVANGFYWRDQRRVEMWTAWNDCILKPQIWDMLHDRDRSITSAVWFALHSKGSGADFICTPAPVHNADGSESPWCFTRPDTLYDELQTKWGHFPLHHFWGPLAGIQSTTWIVDSAIFAAQKYRPNFFYLYLPHLDYAAQKSGPDSKAAKQALVELDTEIGKLVAGFEKAYSEPPLWLVASEYAIVPVDHVLFPNRMLRGAGLLKVNESDGGETLDLAASKAWALVDHQFSHIFVQDPDPKTIKKISRLFAKEEGVAEVITARVARRIRTGPCPQRRHRARLRAQQLAGLLLVGRGFQGAGFRAHGRHPPQARLRPGRAILRRPLKEHSAQHETGERLARRPAPQRRPTRRAALFRARRVHGRHGTRCRHRPNRAAAV